MRLTEILTEKNYRRIEVGYGNKYEVDVFVNPSNTQLQNIVRKSKDNNIRVVMSDKHILCGDGYLLDHDELYREWNFPEEMTYMEVIFQLPDRLYVKLEDDEGIDVAKRHIEYLKNHNLVKRAFGGVPQVGFYGAGSYELPQEFDISDRSSF